MMTLINKNTDNMMMYQAVTGKNPVTESSASEGARIHDVYSGSSIQPEKKPAINTVKIGEGKGLSGTAKILISAGAGFVTGYVFGEITRNSDRNDSHLKCKGPDAQTEPGDSLKMRGFKLAARGALDVIELSAADQICQASYPSSLNSSVDAGGLSTLAGMGANLVGITCLIVGAKGLRESIATSINHSGGSAKPLLNSKFVRSLGTVITGAGLVASAFGAGPMGFPIVAAGTGLSTIGTIAGVLNK
ncbi:MAG: hypothetical protein AB2L14_06620 [Candidatus Xenobiia bacterium LiM19]